MLTFSLDSAFGSPRLMIKTNSSKNTSKNDAHNYALHVYNKLDISASSADFTLRKKPCKSFLWKKLNCRKRPCQAQSQSNRHLQIGNLYFFCLRYFVFAIGFGGKLSKLVSPGTYKESAIDQLLLMVMAIEHYSVLNNNK